MLVWGLLRPVTGDVRSSMLLPFIGGVYVILGLRPFGHTRERISSLIPCLLGVGTFATGVFLLIVREGGLGVVLMVLGMILIAAAFAPARRKEEVEDREDRDP